MYQYAHKSKQKFYICCIKKHFKTNMLLFLYPVYRVMSAVPLIFQVYFPLSQKKCVSLQ